MSRRARARRSHAVSVPADDDRGAQNGEQRTGQQQVHRPVEALRVDDVHQHDAHARCPSTQAERLRRSTVHDRAFGGDDGEDLARA